MDSDSSDFEHLQKKAAIAEKTSASLLQQSNKAYNANGCDECDINPSSKVLPVKSMKIAETSKAIKKDLKKKKKDKKEKKKREADDD